MKVMSRRRRRDYPSLSGEGEGALCLWVLERVITGNLIRLGNYSFGSPSKHRGSGREISACVGTHVLATCVHKFRARAQEDVNQFSHLASCNIYGVAMTIFISALTFALESLSEDAVEHGAAVVAERRRGVRARLEAVRHVELEPLSHQL